MLMPASLASEDQVCSFPLLRYFGTYRLIWIIFNCINYVLLSATYIHCLGTKVGAPFNISLKLNEVKVIKRIINFSKLEE